MGSGLYKVMVSGGIQLMATPSVTQAIATVLMAKAVFHCQRSLCPGTMTFIEHYVMGMEQKLTTKMRKVAVNILQRDSVAKKITSNKRGARK